MPVWEALRFCTPTHRSWREGPQQALQLAPSQETGRVWWSRAPPSPRAQLVRLWCQAAVQQALPAAPDIPAPAWRHLSLTVLLLLRSQGFSHSDTPCPRLQCIPSETISLLKHMKARLHFVPVGGEGVLRGKRKVFSPHPFWDTRKKTGKRKTPHSLPTVPTCCRYQGCCCPEPWGRYSGARPPLLWPCAQHSTVLIF